MSDLVDVESTIVDTDGKFVANVTTTYEMSGSDRRVVRMLIEDRDGWSHECSE